MPKYRYRGPPLTVRAGGRGDYNVTQPFSERRLDPGDEIEPVGQPIDSDTVHNLDASLWVVIGPAPTHSLFLVPEASVEEGPQHMTVEELIEELATIRLDGKIVCMNLAGYSWLVTGVIEEDEEVWLQATRVRGVPRKEV